MGYGACTIIHADDTQTTKRTRQNVPDKTCRRRDVPRRVSTIRWVFTRGFSRGGGYAVGLYSHIYIMRMCPHDNTCRRYTNDKTYTIKRTRRIDVPRHVYTTRGFVRGGIIYIIIRVRNGRDYELRNSSALTTFIPSSLISDAMVSMVITYLG